MSYAETVRNIMKKHSDMRIPQPTEHLIAVLAEGIDRILRELIHLQRSMYRG